MKKLNIKFNEIRKKRQKSLYVYLSLSFILILITVLFSTAIYFGYIRHNILDEQKIEMILDEEETTEMMNGIKNVLIYGLLVGLGLVAVVATHIIKPIRRLTEATKKVAAGDFSVNVEIKRNDEIGDLTNNFNKMVQELNSIEYLRKDFISSVSHELKTPIASIQGFTKLLADDNLAQEEKMEYINIIVEETNRLSNLSKNMLILSKYENQDIITNKTKYRLDEQLRKAVIMLDEKISKKNIKVSLKSKPIVIIEDSDIIMEIWLNLLSNSIKYSNENGRIDISTYKEDEYIKVTIKDNGIGIAKDKQDRIFEKFYQADKSHSQEGNGLGLAIVKRIINMINGKIEFESEEEKGTTFSVYIKQVS